MEADQFTIEEMQQVAGLYCEGVSIPDIASTLAHGNEAQVRRLLDSALRKKYFHYEPVLALNEMTPELSSFLNNEVLTQAIASALTATFALRHIHVHITRSPLGMFQYYHLDPQKNRREYEIYLDAETASLEIIGKRAALDLSRKLFNSKEHTIGLNYGASVLFTIKALSPLPTQVSKTITIVSLFGDLDFFDPDGELPLMRKDISLACNDIVNLFASRLGPEARAELLNAPGFIPHSFSDDDDTFERIRQFLTTHASYVRIFGSQHHTGKKSSPPLIADIDTLITGFGSVDNYTATQRFLRSWLSESELDRVIEYSRSGEIVGDFGGHFVTSPQLASNNSDIQNFLQRINKRLIATNPHHFMTVANRHAKDPGSGAGVVGIAAGGRKARILHALLAQPNCPISSLYIDTHCALALLHLIDLKRYKALIKEHGHRIIIKSESWSEGTRSIIPQQ
jgi:DNA-binding transcriptional regulator LsrR (DeoR family)